MLVAQLCLTLFDPVDWDPPGSSILGILWARILEWVAISFSRGSFQPGNRTQVSRIVERPSEPPGKPKWSKSKMFLIVLSSARELLRTCSWMEKRKVHMNMLQKYGTCESFLISKTKYRVWVSLPQEFVCIPAVIFATKASVL